MAMIKEARLARAVGGSLLSVGVLLTVVNHVLFLTQDQILDKWSIVGPAFAVIGLAMVLIPGAAPAEELEKIRAGPAVKRMFRGLSLGQKAVWALAFAGGIAVGFWYRLSILGVPM